MTPRPFLKWAGGKGQMLDKLLPLLPKQIDTYYEPFLGGGAVFFALARERRFRKAILSDANEELINSYIALKSEPKRVLSELKRHAAKHCKEYYYEVRSAKPRGSAQRAARTIYLNRTGFNGLYRVNQKGQFNVPFGAYKNPKIIDIENLYAVSLALQDTEISVCDFSAIGDLGSKDAAYFDPPYLPVGPQSFTRYHKDEFGKSDHNRLAKFFVKLQSNGACVVLTNSSAADTYTLYSGQRILEIDSRRSINSNASARGAVKDVVVYTKPGSGL